jgi:hypothetical protein
MDWAQKRERKREIGLRGMEYDRMESSPSKTLTFEENSGDLRDENGWRTR